MAVKYQFEDGQVFEFDQEPTDQDLEDTAREFSVKPSTEFLKKGSEVFQTVAPVVSAISPARALSAAGEKMSSLAGEGTRTLLGTISEINRKVPQKQYPDILGEKIKNAGIKVPEHLRTTADTSVLSPSVVGATETALEMGTGFPATILGGLASLLNGDPSGKTLAKVQQQLTYKPGTEEGKITSSLVERVFTTIKESAGEASSWNSPKGQEALRRTLGESYVDLVTYLIPFVKSGKVSPKQAKEILRGETTLEEAGIPYTKPEEPLARPDIRPGKPDDIVPAPSGPSEFSRSKIPGESVLEELQPGVERSRDMVPPEARVGFLEKQVPGKEPIEAGLEPLQEKLFTPEDVSWKQEYPQLAEIVERPLLKEAEIDTAIREKYNLPAYEGREPGGAGSFFKQRGAVGDLGSFQTLADSLEKKRMELVLQRRGIEKRLEDKKMPPDFGNQRVKEIQSELDKVNKELNNVLGVLFKKENPDWVTGQNIIDPEVTAQVFDISKARRTGKGSFGQGGAINLYTFNPFAALEKELKKLGKGISKPITYTPSKETGKQPISESARTVRSLTKTTVDQWLLDRRENPLEVLNDAVAKRGELEDIGPQYRIADNALLDRSVSLLSEGYKGAGDLIKWSRDQVSIIKQDVRLAIEQDLTGGKFVSHKGRFSRKWDYRKPSQEGVLTRLDSLSEKGLKDVMEKVWEGNFTEVVWERKDFSNEAQFQAYKTLREVLDRQIQKANEYRESIGEEPIPYRKGYFPITWAGDYRLFIKAADDPRPVEVLGFKNRFQRDFVQKQLEEKFPQFKYKPTTLDTRTGLDLSAFDSIIAKAPHKDRAALREAVADVLRKRGWLRHGQPRLGVAGNFLGLENPKEFKKVIENYTSGIHNYIGNKRISSMQARLETLPPELQNKLPNALEYISDYLEQARGGSLDRLTLISDMAEWMTDRAGVGPSAPRKALKDISGIATLWWLTKIPFLLSQPLQPLIYGTPKLRAMVKEGEIGSSIEASIVGYKHTVLPDESAIRGINWARKQGKLDSRIVELISERFSGLPQRIKGAELGVTGDALRWGFGKIEQETVRVPLFLMFEAGLRKTMKNENLRFEKAAELMDYYAIMYEQHTRPLMWNKAGIAGEAIAPLRQFQQGVYGQYIEYIRHAKNHKDVAPLAFLIGGTILTAGVKGLIAVQEGDAVIEYIINPVLETTFDTNIPTITEYLYTKSVPDILVSGGSQYVLGGMDISPSLSSPRVTEFFGSAPLSFATDIGSFALAETKNLLGEATQKELYAARRKAAPPLVGQGLVESVMGPGDGVVLSPKTGEQVYKRTLDERIMRYVGGRSGKETKAMALLRLKEKEERRLSLKAAKASELIVDKLVKGERPSKELLKEYVDSYGSIEEISSKTKGRLVGERTSPLVRELMKVSNSKDPQKKAKAIMLLKKYKQLEQAREETE